MYNKLPNIKLNYSCDRCGESVPATYHPKHGKLCSLCTEEIAVVEATVILPPRVPQSGSKPKNVKEAAKAYEKAIASQNGNESVTEEAKPKTTHHFATPDSDGD